MGGYLAFLPVTLQYWNKDQGSATVRTYGVFHCCSFFSQLCPVMFVHFKKQKYKKSCTGIFLFRANVLYGYPHYVL